MDARPVRPGERLPQTLAELEVWVREQLQLPEDRETLLLAAVDAIFQHHEQLARIATQGALEALETQFADKLQRASARLSQKDKTISDISWRFGQLVAELTEKSRRDAKTKLMNFAHFTERLEAYLTFEQRGRWCAVGMADIAGFKQYNDVLGHAVGDRIIEQVAHLLRERARSTDLLAQEPADGRDLHGRFGGDEFCFMLPDLMDGERGFAIAERFRESVRQFDWTHVDSRLEDQSIRVDIGLVCLELGQPSDRRTHAVELAAHLMERADHLMYDAKNRAQAGTAWHPMRVIDGRLIDLPSEEPEAVPHTADPAFG